MMNISKKIILLFCIVLLTTHDSWSQNIVLTSYNCTGSGSANLAVTPTTNISSYSWKNTANPSVVIGTTASITQQPSGTYTVTIVKSGATSTLSSLTVVAGIVPTAPSVTPATVATPICGATTQVLTSTTAANYTWKRDGTAITGSTNSITAIGNDVGSPGTYSYTVSTTNATTACTSTSNAVVLSMSPTLATPTISAADGNTLICGSSTQTLSASGGGASYVWRRGSTTLANTGSNLIVTGTDATGTFTYTAAIANSAGCPLIFSTTSVSLTLSAGIATPTITTLATTTPVCGTDTKILTASSGGTSYIWKRDGATVSGSTNSITVTGNDVTVGNTYNYTVSNQNSVGCVSSESAPYALKVSPKPTTPTITPATFTPNVVCGTDFKTLTATPGGTTYTWKRGGVAVTGSTTNSLNVLGTDATVGGTYVYTVSLTNSVGCVSDDSPTGVTLQLFPTIPPKPTITPNGAVTFCEGGSVTLNYTRGVSSDMKIWSRTTGADTTTTNADGITVRSTNTFTVKTKDANGCFSLPSNSFLVTVNLLPAKPIIDKGIVVSICDLDSIILSSDNKGTGNYLWNNGKTTQSILVKTAGNYSLTFTDANICTSLPSLVTVLTVNPLPAKPTITALRSLEFCYRDFTTIKASSTTANTTFEWDNGAKTAQIDVALITQSTKTEFIKRSAKSISDKGCKSKDPSDEITITVNPLPTIPTISSSGPLIFCPDSTVNLTSTDSPNGIYKWINAKDNSEFSNKKTVLIDTTSKYFTTTSLGKIGKFYVRTISDKNCVSDTSKNVTITVRDAPQPASILPSPITATVCDGGKVTLKALFANGNVKTYSWRDEATQKEVSTEPEVSVITSGSFSVKVRDVFGCFAAYSKILKVTVNPLPTKPSISVIKSKIFCDEDSTIVQSSLPNTTANGNKNMYRWIVDGQTVLESFSRTFSWKKASNISVAVTDSNGCKALATSDTIRTMVNPLPASPSITARGPIPFCADKNVTLSAIGVNGVTFKWSTGATTSNITTNTAGNVTVQAINGFGCLSKPSQAVQVRVNPLPTTPKLTANGVTTFCDGSKVRIVSSSPFQAYWFRSTTDSIGKGEDLTSIFASKTGNYFAKVQDDNGCISLASTPIAVDSRPNPTPTVVKQIGTFSLDAQGVGDENGYIWRYNGDVQKDLTTRIIKAKKDGDYQVQASITYTGVALTGGKLVCYSNTSGVIKYEQDPSFNGFSIFPNPTANGEINVEVIEDLIGATVTVYSIYGQLIAEYKVDKFNTLKKIQLPDYHGSTFIVKVATDGFDRTRRVVTLKL
jgi:hypothetical protein